MPDEIVLRNQTCRGHKGLLWLGGREAGDVMTFNRAQERRMMLLVRVMMMVIHELKCVGITFMRTFK